MRPRPAHVRIVPIADGAVHVCDDGDVLVGLLLHADATLPALFTPAAWLGAAGRAFDCYLFQRFAK